MAEELRRRPWSIGVLAIAGFPFVTSGFFSKDTIIAAAWHTHPVIAWCLIGAATLTAFYMFRLFAMTFLGKPKDHHVHEHAHESPLWMTVPLIVLAVFSVVAGYDFWHGTLLDPAGASVTTAGSIGHHEHSTVVMALAIAAGVGGLLLGFVVFGSGDPAKVARWKSKPFRAIEPACAAKFGFDEFYRDDAASAESAEGLGLGLSIVARLAELLGHRVEVRSVLGRGSCFSVTVPEAAARPADAPEPGPAAGDGLQGQRVLVIDNDDAVLGSTADLLRSWGCHVQAQHGLPERPAAADTPPDLLLVDMHLDHGDDGVAVVTRLRSHHGRAIPALVMTGDVTVATRERLAAVGLRLRSALTRLLQRG